MNRHLNIGHALLDGQDTLVVSVDGYTFAADDKYTILELGWVVYLAAKEIPARWMLQHGETRPAEEGGTCELASHERTLVTTHPVLVALSLRAWWHGNGRPIPTAPEVPIPTFDDAAEEVRARPIFNDFNLVHAGTVPGLLRWKEQSE